MMAAKAQRAKAQSVAAREWDARAELDGALDALLDGGDA